MLLIKKRFDILIYYKFGMLVWSHAGTKSYSLPQQEIPKVRTKDDQLKKISTDEIKSRTFLLDKISRKLIMVIEVNLIFEPNLQLS